MLLGVYLLLIYLLLIVCVGFDDVDLVGFILVWCVYLSVFNWFDNCCYHYSLLDCVELLWFVVSVAVCLLVCFV